MLNASREFPNTRLRRTRQFAWSRRLVREHCVQATDLIWPIFVIEGTNQREAILTMPGVERLSIDLLCEEVAEASALGIPAVALFPVVDAKLKTARGDEALNPDNLICRAVRALKGLALDALDMGVICDVALDPYTDHGHDGIIINDEIANDASVEILAQQALVQVEAGCDIIAPSDMQDGRIGTIRQYLDQHHFSNTLILSYAAKYCSNFYGPFRDAIGSSSNLAGKGKQTYQQDPANSEEALHEIALDIREGADMVMIKPGMPYLDIIQQCKQHFKIPTFAYQVSGEYTMLRLLSQQTGTHWQHLLHEALLCFKRAGADGIFTYAAKEIAMDLMK